MITSADEQDSLLVALLTRDGLTDARNQKYYFPLVQPKMEYDGTIYHNISLYILEKYEFDIPVIIDIRWIS